MHVRTRSGSSGFRRWEKEVPGLEVVLVQKSGMPKVALAPSAHRALEIAFVTSEKRGASAGLDPFCKYDGVIATPTAPASVVLAPIILELEYTFSYAQLTGTTVSDWSKFRALNFLVQALSKAAQSIAIRRIDATAVQERPELDCTLKDAKQVARSVIPDQSGMPDEAEVETFPKEVQDQIARMQSIRSTK